MTIDPPPNATRIFLLRHAETAQPDRFHGAESDVELGPRGLEQAEAVAAALAPERPAAVYTSAMRRAVQTAEPIARACGLELRTLHDLHERRMGPLSGAPCAEHWDTYNHTRRLWCAGDLDATHPGGESFAAIRARVVPILEGLARSHVGQTIVIVAHGVVIRVLLCTLLPDLSPADFLAIPIENAVPHDLRVEGGTWSIQADPCRAPATHSGPAW